MRGPVRAERVVAALALARSQRGRLSCADAAAILGVADDDIPALAEELSGVGVPPWAPDDFIDLSVERDGLRLYLDLGLAQPMRLCAAEAAVILACLKAASGPPALLELCTSAALKIRRAIAGDVVESEGAAHGLSWSQEPGHDPALLSACARAATEGRFLDIRYWNASRSEVQDRRVEALRLFSHTGRWYLEAVPEGAGESRFFRVDRLLSAAVSTVASHGAPGPGALPRTPLAFRASQPNGEAVVRFAAALRPRVSSLWPSARVLAEEADGTVVLALPIATEPALLRELFVMGTGWEVGAPQSLRALCRAWCEDGLPGGRPPEGGPTRHDGSLQNG